MEQTLRILNELADQKLVESYAIGGAMAAFFYSEAVVTEDLDAFVLIALPLGALLTLAPVYDYLRSRGAVERREHLILAGTLVQVIPAYDALTEEAVRQAVERRIGQTPTRVMRAEHLIAIALKTGRAKDHARIALLIEEADVDITSLTDILTRHELLDRWNRFKSSQV
jgi:hypothetical protein